MTMFLAFLPLLSAPGDVPLISGIGNYHRTVKFSDPTAEKYFDQGLAQLYAFHKSSATKSFQAAEKLDPKAAMAWWGEAMSYGPDINFTFVDDDFSKKAIVALDKGGKVAQPGVEADLIVAAKLRFKGTDRAVEDRAYSKAMADLYARYPDDVDIASLYADSLLILSPWNQYLPDGSPKSETTIAVKALKHALEISPDHLYGNHLYIHALEASQHPEDALPSADRLSVLAPALGHLVHMPSHIYVRTGRWEQAIVQNQKALAGDSAYFKGRLPAPNYVPYMIHNGMMLAYAATMNGSAARAKGVMNDLKAILPKESMTEISGDLDPVYSIDFEVDKRFGRWKSILAAPAPPSQYTTANAMRLGDRAIAFAVLKRPAEAKAEMAKFLAAQKKVGAPGIGAFNTPAKLLAIEEHQVRGELLVQSKKFDKGIAELEKAVKAEDALRYNEPPDWIQPTRDTLGAALIVAGRSSEAVAVYTENLRRVPNDGWSLMGMAQAYDALKKPDQAAIWRERYLQVWSKSDPKTTTSCLCLPGKTK